MYMLRVCGCVWVDMDVHVSVCARMNGCGVETRALVCVHVCMYVCASERHVVCVCVRARARVCCTH